MPQYQMMGNGWVKDKTTGTQFFHDASAGSRDSVKFSAWLAAGNTPDPADPAPAIVPEVTMRQARLQLLSMGLLQQVGDAVAAMPGEAGEAARIEWEYAATVRGDNPTAQAIMALLGFTESQVSDFFSGAAAR